MTQLEYDGRPVTVVRAVPVLVVHATAAAAPCAITATSASASSTAVCTRIAILFFLPNTFFENSS